MLMSWEEWSRHDAVSLAELVRQGQVRPAELAKQVVRGIAKVNPALNAVIEVFEDVVDIPLNDGMNPDGPFAGVPYLMKDAGPTLKGRKQEMGSLLLRGAVTPADSFLTTRIREAGLNVVGRTSVPEFAVCGSAENPKIYITHNPWNLAYTTGGSSSGAGAIVASGAIPMAHASDGGGSIRGPAGINGTIGLKVSRGVFSAAPKGSDLGQILGVEGCHSRTVRDTAAFVDACRGAAPGEFMPFWSPAEPYLKLIERDPPKLKIALSHEWGDYRSTPHIVSELERVGRFLEGLGHHVEWALPDVDYRAAYTAQTLYYTAVIATFLERQTKLRGYIQPTRDCCEPMTFTIWEAGKDLRYTEVFSQTMVTSINASRLIGQFFQTWDILLTPVSALPTHKLGTLEFTTLNEEDSAAEWFRKLWGLYPYTPLANLCGIPAISLPIAQHEHELPLGIHAVARQANDGLLLQLAAQIERALHGEWNDGRRPAVHVTR